VFDWYEERDTFGIKKSKGQRSRKQSDFLEISITGTRSAVATVVAVISSSNFYE
jgi:hypothetical protein